MRFPPKPPPFARNNSTASLACSSASPLRERAALVLRDLEGLSGRQVAEILQVSEETVRTAIFRAKEKLRQWMN